MKISGIKIEVVRKKIKNVHLSVLPPNGRVRVSVPENMPEESVELFIRTKITWIKKQQEKFYNQPRLTERQYVSGESLYIWGKQYYLLVNYGYRNSLVINNNKVILTCRKESTLEQREKYINKWYRDLLQDEIIKYLPKWEKLTTLSPSEWKIKKMITCWGTCNYETKKITFNLHLAKKPIECIEYIILHELIHTKVKTHNDQFVKIMDKYMPTWKSIRKKLNDCKLDDFKMKTGDNNY